MSARYSPVERKVWRDEKVRQLSRGAPNARELWFYLLTCDSQNVFPGLYVLRLIVAADDLGWSVDDVRRCLDEIARAGMAEFDEATSVVWLPRAPRKRVENTGVTTLNAKGWRNAWSEIPDSVIARKAFAGAFDALKLANPTEKTPAGAQAAAFAANPPAWFTHDDGPGGGRSVNTEAQGDISAPPKQEHRANAKRTPCERQTNAVRTQEKEFCEQDRLEKEPANACAREGQSAKPGTTAQAGAVSPSAGADGPAGFFEILSTCHELRAQESDLDAFGLRLLSRVGDRPVGAPTPTEALEAAIVRLRQRAHVANAPGLLTTLFVELLDVAAFAAAKNVKAPATEAQKLVADASASERAALAAVEAQRAHDAQARAELEAARASGVKLPGFLAKRPSFGPPRQSNALAASRDEQVSGRPDVPPVTIDAPEGPSKASEGQVEDSSQNFVDFDRLAEHVRTSRQNHARQSAKPASVGEALVAAMLSPKGLDAMNAAKASSDRAAAKARDEDLAATVDPKRGKARAA